METIVERAAGLDVHKAQVTACVRLPGRGAARAEEVAEFATTVRGLLALRDWLKAQRVTQVAVEATGVYWKPGLGDPRRRVRLPARQCPPRQAGAGPQDRRRRRRPPPKFVLTQLRVYAINCPSGDQEAARSVSE